MACIERAMNNLSSAPYGLSASGQWRQTVCASTTKQTRVHHHHQVRGGPFHDLTATQLFLLLSGPKPTAQLSHVSLQFWQITLHSGANFIG